MISNLVSMTFAYVNERRKSVRERGSFVGVLSANFRNEIDIREELCYDSRPENAKNSERGGKQLQVKQFLFRIAVKDGIHELLLVVNGIGWEVASARYVVAEIICAPVFFQ